MTSKRAVGIANRDRWDEVWNPYFLNQDVANVIEKDIEVIGLRIRVQNVELLSMYSNSPIYRLIRMIEQRLPQSHKCITENVCRIEFSVIDGAGIAVYKYMDDSVELYFVMMFLEIGQID